MKDICRQIVKEQLDWIRERGTVAVVCQSFEIHWNYFSKGRLSTYYSANYLQILIKSPASTKSTAVLPILHCPAYCQGYLKFYVLKQKRWCIAVVALI